MMVANIVIERPREVVWAFFTEPAKWESWWGGAVKAAEWREGGQVEWALGGSSPITAFTPGASVLLQGAWMDTTFIFEPEGTGRTAVRIEEGPPKGGASFKDGGANHLEQLKSALAKLKDLVESGTPATSVGNASASPSAPSAPSAPGAVKADWYTDPAGRHQYRYWEGTSWTDHVADGGVASVEPLEIRPTPAKAAEPARATPDASAPNTVGGPAGQTAPATGGCKAFQAGRCVVQGSDTGPCDWNPSDWQHCGVVIENRKYGQW